MRERERRGAPRSTLALALARTRTCTARSTRRRARHVRAAGGRRREPVVGGEKRRGRVRTLRDARPASRSSPSCRSAIIRRSRRPMRDDAIGRKVAERRELHADGQSSAVNGSRLLLGDGPVARAGAAASVRATMRRRKERRETSDEGGSNWRTRRERGRGGGRGALDGRVRAAQAGETVRVALLRRPSSHRRAWCTPRLVGGMLSLRAREGRRARALVSCERRRERVKEEEERG